jgi:predicted alpha/beta superfamily hydrolase
MDDRQTPLNAPADWPAATVLGTQSFRLASAKIGQVFTIDVFAPPMLPPHQKAPVLFVLDGDYTFATVAQIARNLQIDRGGIAPVYIVGIGYRDESGTRPPLGLRTRDLTPSDDARYMAMMRAAPAPFTLPPDIAPGGANDFLSFITDELTPCLAGRLPIDVDDLGIAGASLGGLFALHVLFTAPTVFRRHIAVSPAIWWDDCLLLREEAAFAERRDDLSARVYLAAGGLEEQVEPSTKMLSNLDAMAGQLGSRNYPSLELSREVLPDEGHLSVYPAAVSRGLRAAFGRTSNRAEWSSLPTLRPSP